jgi:hypothetical protein
MTPAGLTFFYSGLLRGKRSFGFDAISFHWVLKLPAQRAVLPGEERTKAGITPAFIIGTCAEQSNASAFLASVWLKDLDA